MPKSGVRRALLSCLGFFAVLFCYFLAFVANAAWSVPRVLRHLEFACYDARMKLARHPQPSGRVVIVDLDEKTLAEADEWPLSRAVFAEVLDRLAADGARAVGFDFALVKPANSAAHGVGAARDAYLHEVPASARSQPFLARLNQLQAQQDGDARFADSLRRTPIGVLAHIFNDAGAATSGEQVPAANSAYPFIGLRGLGEIARGQAADTCLPLFAVAAGYRVGYINSAYETDGVIRRYSMVMGAGGNFYPPLAVQVARAYLGAGQNVGVYVRGSSLALQLGSMSVPLDWAGNLLIDYIGPARSFAYFSLADVAKGRFVAGTFRDKAVLVGASLPLLHDLHRTPLQRIGFPGVDVHANVVDAVLTRRTIYNGLREGLLDVLFIALLIFLLPALLRGRTLGRILGVSAGLLLLLAGVDLAAFEYGRMWLNATMPALVVFVCGATAFAFRSFRLQGQQVVAANAAEKA